MKPDAALLDGLLVLDLSQFLSGPSAALRLADLGARVIKVERPVSGDICRSLYVSDTRIRGDSTLFHAINRGKESFAADLKSPGDREAVRALVSRADVLIQNFRPGVIDRLGLGYDAARTLNPRLVYASISGYGEDGPWAAFPGQDLLAQALSGLTWLSGDRDGGPVPMGLSVADMLAGHVAVEGILAALVRRGVSGEGTHVQTSLLEAVVDLQFEVLTTYLNDHGQPLPRRAAHRNAHAYLAAPYGIYATANGYLALAMTPLLRLAELLALPQLVMMLAAEPDAGFARRDSIKRMLADCLAAAPTAHWLALLREAGVWCAPVLDWPTLFGSEAFKSLDMLQMLTAGDGTRLQAMRTPLRVCGVRRHMDEHAVAPRVGEHTVAIREEFGLS